MRSKYILGIKCMDKMKRLQITDDRLVDGFLEMQCLIFCSADRALSCIVSVFGGTLILSS